MTAKELSETQAAWDEIADGFDEYATPLTISFAEAVLQRVDLEPGMRFLDVAAGSGALSIPAAHLGAEVVATDISQAMVELLTARARNEEPVKASPRTPVEESNVSTISGTTGLMTNRATIVAKNASVQRAMTVTR